MVVVAAVVAVSAHEMLALGVRAVDHAHLPSGTGLAGAVHEGGDT